MSYCKEHFPYVFTDALKITIPYLPQSKALVCSCKRQWCASHRPKAREHLLLPVHQRQAQCE